MVPAVRQHHRDLAETCRGGPDMGKPTAPRLQPGASAERADWLERYRPRRVDAEIWRTIRPFVLNLADGRQLVGHASAARTVRTVARLAAWCVGEGIAL